MVKITTVTIIYYSYPAHETENKLFDLAKQLGGIEQGAMLSEGQRVIDYDFSTDEIAADFIEKAKSLIPFKYDVSKETDDWPDEFALSSEYPETAITSEAENERLIAETMKIINESAESEKTESFS